jgi:hypothetical protein
LPTVVCTQSLRPVNLVFVQVRYVSSYVI